MPLWLGQEVQEMLRHPEDRSMNRSHISRVRPDDCRLVANNSGSVANNLGLTPSIDADNSGSKSRCLQVEPIINAGRYR